MEGEQGLVVLLCRLCECYPKSGEIALNHGL